MSYCAMCWSPSILRMFEDRNPVEKQDKKVYLKSNNEIEVCFFTKSTDNIFASYSKSNTKKPNIRPVMLTICYADELVFEVAALPEHTKCAEINEELLTTFNEISSAVKESMRIEKEIIECLEKNKTPKQTETYITTKAKNFFISKYRLLGEILKAQRKIEKIRTNTFLSSQIALEHFIKKLCILKVLADKIETAQTHTLPYITQK